MIVYKIDNGVYINLTNKCSNNCSFCVRSTSARYDEYDLWLKKEPTAEEVIKEIDERFPDAEEYVFCGYGEPLYAFDTLIKVAEELKKRGKRTRLNTNGQADLIVGEGVAKKIKGLIDTVSISLNAPNAKEYNEICRCAFGKKGFDSLVKFAKECKNEGINTVFSVVKTPGFDVEKAEEFAKNAGIKLRVRELIK